MKNASALLKRPAAASSPKATAVEKSDLSNTLNCVYSNAYHKKRSTLEAKGMTREKAKIAARLAGQKAVTAWKAAN